ncbi:MAG: hypothetical protein RLY31_489 [Bacteroidota bacterium]|jgi:peptidyl-prolyl cis-trans isomerase B (cyclophilin B)
MMSPDCPNARFLRLFCLLPLVLLWACNKPIADFSFRSNHAPLQVPLTVVFENHSRHADEFVWNFGNGASDSSFTPSHRFLSSGNFTVSLTARKGRRSHTTSTQLQLFPPENCLVEIQTPLGNMTAVLYDATPIHRDNFEKLTEKGFFNELLFHRVIPGFMIQGGDPNSRKAGANQPLGSGGPGYSLPFEPVDSLVHVKGALSAARLGDDVNPEKASSGSQFFIVHGQTLQPSSLRDVEARKGIRYTPDQRAKYLEYGGTPHLDGEYTVFGQIINGFDVLDRIADLPTNTLDRPLQDVKMTILLIK